MILGCDPSLQGFGWVLVDQGHIVDHVRWSHAPAPCRLTCFHDWFTQRLAAQSAPTWAVIEGYALGARNGREALGELGGVLRWTLYHAEIPWLIVPPPSLKLWATGSGRAAKAQMRQALRAQFAPLVLSHDEIDALALALLGEAYEAQTLEPSLQNRLALQAQIYPSEGDWNHARFFPAH